MKQVLVRDGRAVVEEVPVPVVGDSKHPRPRRVLVRQRWDRDGKLRMSGCRSTGGRLRNAIRRSACWTSAAIKV